LAITKKSGRHAYAENDKVPIEISINELDDLIIYTYSENIIITRRSKLKLLELLEMIDSSSYETDREMEVRFHFLKKSLTAMVKKRMNDHERIVSFTKGGGKYEDEIDDLVEYISETYDDDIDNETVGYIEEYISDKMKFSFLYKEQVELDNLAMRFKSGDYESLGEFAEEYSTVVKSLHKKLQKAKAPNKYTARDFNSNDSRLEDAINIAHKNFSRPNNKVQTSVKNLNKMLNGGYECQRFYLYLGAPGGWKSGQLIQAALDAKHCNTEWVTKDPTKKPCILYVSQENSQDETLNRLWSHYIGEDIPFIQNDAATVMKMLCENGFNEGVPLEIKYRPNKSISTADVDGMIDDMALDGYEVVMLLHDYLKRINSSEKHAEMYLELGAVCDDFTVIAKDRDIPVVSASQLNRTAFQVIEAALEKGKNNIVKQLGISHVGESVRLIDNSDYVIIINKEKQTTTDVDFLTYKLVKSRAKKQDLHYFAHPFENGMKLKPDYNLAKSLSLLDLGDGLAEYDTTNGGSKPLTTGKKRKKAGKKTVLADFDEDED